MCQEYIYDSVKDMYNSVGNGSQGLFFVCCEDNCVGQVLVVSMNE